MKHLLIALGLTFCCTAPLMAQNTPGNALTPARATQGNTKTGPKTVSRTTKNSRAVYYITSVNPTGSHLPLVVSRYEGRNYPMFQSSPGSNYGTGDVGATGALNVQGALRTLDPAISSTSGR